MTDTAAATGAPHVAGPSPEIAETAVVDGLRINYHDAGQGDPLLLLHGSGPGVSAWANWRLVIPELAQAGRRVIAPDIPGFGYSDPLPEFSMEAWLRSVHGLLDHLGLRRVSVVGNSFGGSLALHMAYRDPELVERLAVMGTGGVAFDLTDGLDEVWGYEPSVEAMHRLLEIFAFDQAFATRELAELRYRASSRDGAHEAYSALFPAPRQRWVDAMALTPDELSTIEVPCLLIHGAEDRVVPTSTTLSLIHQLPNARAHLFGKCGHWVQIERTAEFVALLDNWFSTTTTGR